MEEIAGLIKAFEERNNISIFVTFYGDLSSSVHEFWEEEILSECTSVDELRQFLKETRYKLDEANGRCLSPVQKID